VGPHGYGHCRNRGRRPEAARLDRDQRHLRSGADSSRRPWSSGLGSANAAAWSLPWRVFQRLLPKRPTPKGCSNPISSERCRAEAPPKQWTEARKGRDLRKGGASACPTRPRPVFPSSSAGPPRPIRRNIVANSREFRLPTRPVESIANTVSTGASGRLLLMSRLF
jgi:hypothetical protein